MDREESASKLADPCPITGGARRRPFDTVEPLATDLGITIDSSCDRDDDACVKKAVESYKGPGNVLIW